MDIFTIGYEGVSIEEWKTRLIEAGVTFIVDIRERPISRKKGFSKTALRDHLERINIGYIHYRNLGSPGEIRKRLMIDRDYITFFDEYEKHLSMQEALLQEIVTSLKDHRPCLMCFEKNHRQCHRYSVAKRLEENFPKEVRVVHL